ncbi:hypothetical protein [Bacillus manliponensis]|uniref:hypothetical protein n=1 Tax=Bacillus manliponensis TaxID=574376 RepID=UPI00351552A4
MDNIRDLYKNPYYANPFGINDPSFDESVRQEAMRTAGKLIEDCKTVFNMYNEGIITDSKQAETHIRNIAKQVNHYGDTIKQLAPAFHSELRDYFQSAQGVYYNLKHAETLPKVHRLAEGNYSSEALKNHPQANSPIPFPTPLEMRTVYVPGESEMVAKFKDNRTQQVELLEKLSYINDRRKELEEGRKQVMEKIATQHYDEIPIDQLDDHTRALRQHYLEADETNRELAQLKKEVMELASTYNLQVEGMETETTTAAETNKEDRESKEDGGE